MSDDLLIRILAAVLLGFASAAAGFISRYWLEAFIRGKHSNYVSAMQGTWTGTIKQETGKIGSSQVELKLKTFMNIVYGQMTYEDGRATLTVVGSFAQDRYLNLHYKNINSAILQHGYAILHLGNRNNVISGNFLGVGPVSEKIVRGPMELKHKGNDS